jgi:ParB-like chromosome segregation protein Spo0J
VSGAVEGGQLQLLPARAPGVRRASLLLADLTGFEHAAPDGALVELIARLGLLQPIVVAGSPQARFRIIEGRRRAKAIWLLAEQGRRPTPARVEALILSGTDTGGQTVGAGMTLALHASRSDSPASELAAIEQILAHGGEEARTVKQIAAQTAMPVQTVRRRLRLRNLTPALRAAFDRGKIPVSVAEAAARLTAEQQANLERLLADGQRATLAIVREIARERTVTAAGALPAGLFEDRQTPWRAIARGHLTAALEAVPTTEPEGTLREALGHALALLQADRPPAPADARA